MSMHSKFSAANRTAARFVPATRNALGEAARRHDAGRLGGAERRAGQARLRLPNEVGRVAQVDAVALQLDVMVVVGLRVEHRGRGRRADVHDVAVQQLIERHVVADHADHGCRRVVELRVHGAVAIRPRSRELAHRRVVERGIAHRVHRGAERVAGSDLRRHRIEHGADGGTPANRSWMRLACSRGPALHTAAAAVHASARRAALRRIWSASCEHSGTSFVRELKRPRIPELRR